MDGSSTGISSRDNGIDFALVFNTREFWNDNDFDTLFKAIAAILDVEYSTL